MSAVGNDSLQEGPVWASSPTMNPLESMIWRAESDPRLRSTICALELLDTTPEWERLVAAHEWASRLVPRFRQRVIEPALGLGAPAWVVDPHFDLHYHLRRVRLPDGGGWRALLAAASQTAMTPFDRARSPWEAVLYEGLPDGKAAYLVKLHHATTDGLGAVQLFSRVHSHTRAPSPDKSAPQAPAPERTTPAELLIRQLARDARGAPRVLHGARAGLAGIAHPRRAVSAGLRFGNSLTRVLANPEADASPLLSGRSLSWRFAALDLPFAGLRSASKAAGGSVNDAFLAALLGAFRIYHDQLGAPIESMPIAIPISVRREGDAQGGNRFVAARLAAPVAILDPAERIAAVRSLVKAARAEPAIEALAMMATPLSRLPGWLISMLAGGMTKNNDLQASNVPGIREDVYIAGARIERIYPYAPLPGSATMITLTTCGDTCCIGVNLDPAAITDQERFGACLKEGFDEVLGLGSEPGRAVLRT